MNNGNFKYLVTPSERRLMMLQNWHKPPVFDDWRRAGSTSNPLGYTTTSDMLQITILRHSTMKQKSTWIPSHRAPQKLSIGPFDSKFNSLSFGLAKSPFYGILQWNTKTPEYRATDRPRSSRSDCSIANLILYRLGLLNHDSKTFCNGTQKRLNAEPQSVPEALDRRFRHQV